jgi:hypothetical protein
MAAMADGADVIRTLSLVPSPFSALAITNAIQDAFSDLLDLDSDFLDLNLLGSVTTLSCLSSSLLRHYH